MTAERLFLRDGYDATTIRGIASASGVSVGTVMAVGDKSALLVEVVDGWIADEHTRRASVAGDEHAGLSCAQRLVARVWPFVTIFAEREELARPYLAILVSGAHGSEVMSVLATRLTAEMREVIDASRVGRAPAQDVARACYLAYLGTLLSWSAGALSSPAEVRSVLSDAFAAICGGKSAR